MNCPDAREWFSAWADAALSPSERAELERHLGECPECRRELERFEGTLALVRRAERPRAPVGFVDRVLELARPTPWYRRWGRRLFLPLWVKLPAEAGAALLLAALLSYVVQRTPELGQAVREDMYSSPASTRTPAAPPTTEVHRQLESPAPRSRALSAIRKEGRATSTPAEPPRAQSRAPATTPTTPSSADSPPRGESDSVLGSARQTMATSGGDGSRVARAKTARDDREAAPAGATPPGAPTGPAAPSPEPQQVASARTPPGPPQPTPPSAVSQTAGASAAAPPPAVPTASAGQAAPPPPRDEAKPSAAAKSDAGTGNLALQPSPAPTPAPRPRPAVEERAESARESRPVSPAPIPKAAAPRVLASADVAGRLTVKDGEAAERALASALAQAGGAMLARRHEAGATVVDVVVPRGNYAGFGRALAAIGSWAPDAEPGELPDQVRVTLRLVQ